MPSNDGTTQTIVNIEPSASRTSIAGPAAKFSDRRISEQSSSTSRISAGVLETIHDAWKKWYRDLRQKLYALVVDMLH
jgi:hypothetical protein